MQFHDRDFAYTYLSNYLHDSFGMIRMRELLADQMLDTSRMTDHEVLQQFASCLVSRTVQIAIDPKQTTRQFSATVTENEIDDSTSTPAIETVNEPAPAEQKISEPEEWIVTVTPAMLVAAAKDGIPFCEECARAAQSNTP